MAFKPVSDLYAVEHIEIDTNTTESGIIISAAKEQYRYPARGIIRAVGPDSEEGALKVGDLIAYNAHVESDVVIDGNKLDFVAPHNILCVITED